MSVSGTINSIYQELSSAESRLADFIVANPEQTLQMNGAALAQASETSPSTVSRLARHLGFGNFSEMKLQLSADQSSAVPVVDEEIHAGEPLDAITEKLLVNAERSLHETIDQVKPEVIDALVSHIEQAQQIVCFGVGASYLVALNVAQKWSRIGYAVLATDDLNQMLPFATDKTTKRLFWFVSNSGESPEAVMGAKMVRAAGGTVVAMTKLGDNSLTQNADLVVQTSQPAEATVRFAATQSLHAQFMLIDTIYYAFFSRNYAEVKRRITASRGMVADYKEVFLGAANRYSSMPEDEA